MSERFIPCVQYLSPVSRALCPELPDSVLRIYDRVEGDYVAHDAPRDPERLKAVLARLRAHGRGCER